MTSMFPLARPNGPISSELIEIWKLHGCASKDEQASQDIPYYEKVCVSLYLLYNIEMQQTKKTDSLDVSFERCL